MNINEATTTANSLLTVTRTYHNYLEVPSLQSFRNAEIRDNRDPNTIDRDLERHRNALIAQLIAQASNTSLDVGTRLKAQKQLLSFTEDRSYTALSDTSAEISLSKFIDIERLLSTEGMVMYGSRALNVNKNSSDYDLAFSYESHRFIYNYLRESNTPISDSTEYFTSAPEAGYHTFFKYVNEETKIDIIFVHNDEDLDVIRSSIQDLQSIPSYMLHDKHFRIEVYNKALQHRGWKSKVLIEPRPRANRGTSPWF